MPKMKTKSGVKKRFKLTASGRVKYHPANAAHILTKKSPKRKRHLRKARLVAGTDHKAMSRLLQG